MHMMMESLAAASSEHPTVITAGLQAGMSPPIGASLTKRKLTTALMPALAPVSASSYLAKQNYQNPSTHGQHLGPPMLVALLRPSKSDRHKYKHICCSSQIDHPRSVLDLL
jgi:hypothetical protein